MCKYAHKDELGDHYCCNDKCELCTCFVTKAVCDGCDEFEEIEDGKEK